MTAHIVKQLHENTERPHKPMTRMLMTYEHNKEKTAQLLKMGTPAADQLILKTLKWASHKGVEVIFRPV